MAQIMAMHVLCSFPPRGPNFWTKWPGEAFFSNLCPFLHACVACRVMQIGMRCATGSMTIGAGAGAGKRSHPTGVQSEREGNGGEGSTRCTRETTWMHVSVAELHPAVYVLRTIFHCNVIVILRRFSMPPPPM